VKMTLGVSILVAASFLFSPAMAGQPPSPPPTPQVIFGGPNPDYIVVGPYFNLDVRLERDPGGFILAIAKSNYVGGVAFRNVKPGRYRLAIAPLGRTATVRIEIPGQREIVRTIGPSVRRHAATSLVSFTIGGRRSVNVTATIAYGGGVPRKK